MLFMIVSFKFINFLLNEDILKCCPTIGNIDAVGINIYIK